MKYPKTRIKLEKRIYQMMCESFNSKIAALNIKILFKTTTEGEKNKMAQPAQMIKVSLKELKKLYKNRKNDVQILEIHGLEFHPPYLKYLL